jgi:uncharacterized protein
MAAARLLALDIPPKPTQWVNDYGANLLTSSETEQLNEKLEDLYKRTGTQFLVLIWPSLKGDEMLDYTNRVANMWKVKDDKALMLFVFVQDRKTFIQVGYGLEGVITDAFASDVYRNTLAPSFRQGQYAGGINAAIDQLAKKIDPNYVPVTTGTTAAPSTRPVQQQPVSRGTPGPSGSDIVILVVLFIVFIFVILPMLRRGGGCGGCSGCIFPMFWGGGGGGTFGGGGFSGGGGGWSTGGSWGGGGSSFGGGGAGGSW